MGSSADDIPALAPLRRRVRRIALAIAVLVGLLVPSVNFYLLSAEQRSGLDIVVRLMAAELRRTIYTQGETWVYVPHRLEPITDIARVHPDQLRVVLSDGAGNEVLADGVMPAAPYIRLSQPVEVIGQGSAIIEIVASRRALMVATAIATLIGFGAAVLIFVAVDVLPMRALVRTVAALEARSASAREAQAARVAAEQANRSKSMFLANMSHELRTPLNAILGFTELLEMTAASSLTDRQRGYLGDILKAGRHLLHLIDEILDLARVESGKMPVKPETVAIGDVVEEAVDLVRAIAERQGLSIAALPAIDPAMTVIADRVRLTQVLANVLSNAVKYNRPDGAIEVLFEADDTHVRVGVRDTGNGIPAARLGDLFKPFSRLDADMTNIGGTGIGLALSSRLMMMMDGELTVDSKVGVGSTFWMKLPRGVWA
jgi:signal transduction histidine kinase